MNSVVRVRGVSGKWTKGMKVGGSSVRNAGSCAYA